MYFHYKRNVLIRLKEQIVLLGSVTNSKLTITIIEKRSNVFATLSKLSHLVFRLILKKMLNMISVLYDGRRT